MLKGGEDAGTETELGLAIYGYGNAVAAEISLAAMIASRLVVLVPKVSALLAIV